MVRIIREQLLYNFQFAEEISKRKIHSGTKGRTSILSIESSASRVALHLAAAGENCLASNVVSLRSVKVATPTCTAKAAIPCVLAGGKRF